MALKPQAIELHIEELVLDGFSRASRPQIGDAVERELARLLAENGLPGYSGGAVEIERLDGGAFRVAPGASANAIGKQVAQAIHRPIAPVETKRSAARRGV
jgi:hypothetical protein